MWVAGRTAHVAGAIGVGHLSWARAERSMGTCGHLLLSLVVQFSESYCQKKAWEIFPGKSLL